MANPLFDPNKCPPHSADEATTDFVQDPSVQPTPPPIFDKPDKLIPPDPPIPLSPSQNKCSWVLRKCGSNKLRYVAGDLERYKGKVVRLKDDSSCWHVLGLDCKNPPQSEVEVTGIHANCQQCKGCFRLEACDSAATKITNTDLSKYLDKIVKIEGDPVTCWRIKRWQQCGGAQAVKVAEEFSDCSDCDCYKLVSCHNNTEETWTFTKLKGLLGKTIRIAERPGCWIVQDQGPQYCSMQSIKVTVLGTEEDCSKCKSVVTTDCTTGTKMIVTRAVNEDGDEIDLSEYNGQAIRTSNGSCWRVDLVTPDACPNVSTGQVTVLEAYDDCDKCVGLIELTQCGTSTKIKTYSDLSEWGEVTTGKVFVDQSGTCWEVTATGLPWDQNATVFDPKGTANSCSECAKTYKLTVDCIPATGCQPSNSLPPDKVVQDARLAQAVGKWIRYEGFCYRVSETSSSADAQLGDFAGPFEECEDCLSAGGVTATIDMQVDECDSGGTTKKVMKRFRWVDGLLVEVCNLGCVDKAACGNECDTGSGTPGGGGGGSGVSCAGCTDIPTTLIASFSDPTGNCACLDGLQITLTFDPNTQTWNGSAQACGTTVTVQIFCDAGSTLIFSFYCGSGSGSSKAINIQQCNGSFQGTTTAGDANCCSDMLGNAIVVDVTITS